MKRQTKREAEFIGYHKSRGGGGGLFIQYDAWYPCKNMGKIIAPIGGFHYKKYDFLWAQTQIINCKQGNTLKQSRGK